MYFQAFVVKAGDWIIEKNRGRAGADGGLRQEIGECDYFLFALR